MAVEDAKVFLNMHLCFPLRSEPRSVHPRQAAGTARSRCAAPATATKDCLRCVVKAADRQ